MRVVTDAKEIAGSQPYCIQVAGRDSADYRPARSWFDLSILAMRAEASGPLYLQHHAVLVVGEATKPRLYHWSYWRGRFEDGVLNGGIVDHGPTVTCLPVQDFADGQPLLFPEPLHENYVRYSPHDAYRIPVAWQARWSGGMSRTLSLATASPDFQPLDRRWSELTPGQRDSSWVFVQWDPKWVLELIKDGPRGDVSEQGVELGLCRTTTVTRGKDEKKYISRRYVALTDGPALGDANITVIDCFSPSEAFPDSCQHRFINRGRHFYFRHAPSNVPDWRNMQRRVLELMTSFEVSTNAS
ncbi:hypothetical protein [uncultured Enterovirga sp.]|uniref:hypothetical protein n=1 Tax=uncultured Enterovirga sp. TaxID=2026352 RepID=UPI0035CA5B6E